MSARRWILGVAAAALLAWAAAAPAGAQTGGAPEASRVVTHLPVEVRGPDAARALARLGRQAEALREGRLWGCFSVDVRLEPAAAAPSGAGVAPHVLTVIPQREGQFVRAAALGSADPWAGARDITLGELAFEAADPVRGPLPLLLSERRVTGTDALIEEVMRRTESIPRLKGCRWTGTLEITTVYERYHLTVTSTTELEFVVTPRGGLDGTVKRTGRSAAVSESDVGTCTGSDLEMFPIRLTGTADEDRFELTFRPKAAEPDFTVSCSSGTIDFGGDFIRAAFLPGGTLDLTTRIRDGATAMSKGGSQGRRFTARVTIRPG